MNSKYGSKNREYTTLTLATILRWLSDTTPQTTNSCTSDQEQEEQTQGCCCVVTVLGDDKDLLVEDLTQRMARLSTAPEQPSAGDGDEEPIDFGS
eukprot:g1084.t1